MVVSTYCDIHDVDEPDLPSDFRSCLECGHVYRSKSELRRAYRHERPDPTTWRELFSAIWHMTWVRADDIRFCPLCLHDFLPRSLR